MAEEDTTTRTGTLVGTWEEVRDTLNDLGDMTTSTEWERAAYVWAISSPQPGVRTDLICTDPDATPEQREAAMKAAMRDAGKIPFSNLAAWGCRGLTTRKTVGHYWHYYDDAIREGKAEPVELGGVYRQPDKEWPGFRHYKEDKTAPPPPVAPEPVAAVTPGTPRWEELRAEVIENPDPWVSGDAGLEVFPASHFDDDRLHDLALRNLDQFAAETGQDPDDQWDRRWVSQSFPPADRQPGTSWETHRVLAHNPELMTEGMTREDARSASFGETLRLLRQVNADLKDVSEIALIGGGYPDYLKRYIRFRLHGDVQGWLGRADAALDGVEAYRQYADEHPWLADMFEEDYGKAVPASEKWAIQREKEAAAKARPPSLRLTYARLVNRYGVNAANAKFAAAGVDVPPAGPMPPPDQDDPPRDRVPQVGDHVAGEAPPED